MKHLKFSKHWPPYSAGERADFEISLADRLITRGIATEETKPAVAAKIAADDKQKQK